MKQPKLGDAATDEGGGVLATLAKLWLLGFALTLVADTAKPRNKRAFL